MVIDNILFESEKLTNVLSALAASFSRPNRTSKRKKEQKWDFSDYMSWKKQQIDQKFLFNTCFPSIFHPMFDFAIDVLYVPNPKQIIRFIYLSNWTHTSSIVESS